MDLKIEREWRQTLQSDLDRERDTVAQLSTEALQISRLKKVKRREEFDILQSQFLHISEYDFVPVVQHVQNMIQFECHLLCGL